MPTHECPSEHALERYALDAESGRVADTVTDHVRDCPHCQNRVRAAKSRHSSGSTLSRADEIATQAGAPPVAPERHIEAIKRHLKPPLVPGDIGQIAHLRLRRLLGSGGMGLVFEGYDPDLDRPVAVKLLRPEFGGESPYRARFLREAQATAAIQHDYLVPIYQVGVEGSLLFIAMPLLVGETLESRLRNVGRLSPLDAIRIARQTAEGLAAAHARGLIHRDIKPANLWLELPGDRVKVLDFGLVTGRTEDPGLTAAGMIVGTPHYMSPEQARNQQLDGRADLFSLGCVLYRCLSGALPFPGIDTMAVLTGLATAEPLPLSTWSDAVPPPLARLVRQLMAKRREDRPKSASEVAAELQRFEAALSGGPPSVSRRRFLAGAAVAGVIGAGGLAGYLLRPRPLAVVGPNEPPILVGVLHSATGTMADSESAVADATMLAIDEVNASGGVLGRRVKAVVRDGQSEAATFADEAIHLLDIEKVVAVFGCWTSASRRTVKPLFEARDGLLFYPVQYEGLEQSPNIVYMGAAPNQQILPAVQWCLGFAGKRRLFLVGSDYVFPRTANAIIRDELKAKGGEVVGEEYIPLGSSDVASVVAKVRAAAPDAILNTINGDTNVAFFRALRQAGITPAKVPTMSFSIAEQELRSLAARDITGDYAAWNYFQSIESKENARFVAAIRKRYGPQRVTTDPMEAAYCGVHLWAKAANRAGSVESKAVRAALGGVPFEGPGGVVEIDSATQHANKIARIGQIVSGGQFEIVYSSQRPLRPVPYPPSRTPAEWDAFLADLKRGWGGQWMKPPG